MFQNVLILFIFFADIMRFIRHIFKNILMAECIQIILISFNRSKEHKKINMHRNQRVFFYIQMYQNQSVFNLTCER